MSEIEVRISEPNYSFASDSLNVYVIRKITETQRQVMNMTEGGFVTWTEIGYPAAEEVKPTVQLQNDIAILLRDALNARFHGTGDVNTIRADLLHERGRVDKCIDTLLGNSMSLADVAGKLANAG
jgi:hypothetical protein